MAIDVGKATDRWVSGMSSGASKATAGVNAVTESPTAKAATQEATEKYRRGIEESISSGKRAAALNRVSRESWINSMIQKGIPRMAGGASAAKEKMRQFLSAFLPHVDAGAQAVRQMPSGTYEERKARAVAMMDHNHNFSYKG